MTDQATRATPHQPGAYPRSPEPFFERHGPVGVLLLHGYSGAPSELRAMGAALAAEGFTVCGPLLAGHRHLPASLHGIRWQDWAASAAEGLARLREHCPRVIVGGLSVGGLLALHLAAVQHVHGVIAMAPALHLHGGPQLRLTGLLKHVMPWFYPLARADFSNPSIQASVRPWAPDADLTNPAVVARIRQEARIPVGSLYEIVRLQDHVRRELPRVTAPLLLMQGRKDTIVARRSVDEVAARVRAPDVRLAWFEHSGHLLPNEAERETVWATAAEWVRGHAKA